MVYRLVPPKFFAWEKEILIPSILIFESKVPSINSKIRRVPKKEKKTQSSTATPTRTLQYPYGKVHLGMATLSTVMLPRGAISEGNKWGRLISLPTISTGVHVGARVWWDHVRGARVNTT